MGPEGKMEKIIESRSPDETLEVASYLASVLRPGDLVALVGDLGAGKTVFVKGLAKGLGLEDYEYVNSPSFVVLKEYRAGKELYHFDVYRLDASDFSETLDYEKYFYGQGITVVEWADKIRDFLPEEYLEVEIINCGGMKRHLIFRPAGEVFHEAVSALGFFKS